MASHGVQLPCIDKNLCTVHRLLWIIGSLDQILNINCYYPILNTHHSKLNTHHSILNTQYWIKNMIQWLRLTYAWCIRKILMHISQCPFLETGRCLIDIEEGTMTLKVYDEELKIDVRNTMKYKDGVATSQHIEVIEQICDE